MIRAWQQGSQSTSVHLLKHGISRDGCWSSQVLFYIVQCKVEHFFVCMCILGVSTIRLDINSFIGGIVMVDDDERRRGGKAAASLFWVREGGATLRYSQLLWKLMMPLKTLSIDCADSLTGQVAIICAQWDYEQEEEKGRMQIIRCVIRIGSRDPLVLLLLRH